MLQKPDSCKPCVLYGNGCGFVPADGTGSNGVLVVLEAAGQDEAAEGKPTIGKAGHYLWSQLARTGLERDDFRIHNVLSCRPPDNKLAKMPYEKEAIEFCSPNLDATIYKHIEACLDSGKTPVILTLGRIAFKRIMGYDDKSPILREDYLCYPLWSERYGVWVLAADHPAFIMRGNHNLVPTLQFAAKRCVEIAVDGLTQDRPFYLLDPLAEEFEQWAQQYLKVAASSYLSYDIETPHKQGSNEEHIAKEDQIDYTILRCSFCYEPGNAVSVPWKAEYLPTMHKLFGSGGALVGWNNQLYDDPRIKAQGIQMNGDILDAMMGWHVLNSALPKSLGFVTPFYWKTTSMWKHLANSAPSFYNAKDADAALRCWLGIQRDLKNNGLWHVFDRHVIQVNRVFAYMSKMGVLLDQEMRNEFEEKVGAELREVESRIQDVVPIAAKEHKLYKKVPKSTDGMVQVATRSLVHRCNRCGTVKPPKSHFKVYKKKDNPCGGAEISVLEEDVYLWARVLPFRLSKTALTRYQTLMGHKPIIDRKENKVTFDEKAILRLTKTYPRDPLYPLILKQRGASKLISTYIGVTEDAN